METVTVSPKYQVVIPRSLRESLGIQPGQKLRMIQYGDRIECVPVKSIKDMRGFLKGMNPNMKRERDRL